MSEDAPRFARVSWPWATWLVPLTPAATLWALVLVGTTSENLNATAENPGGLVVVLFLAVLGALLMLTRHPRVRGAGMGLLAGELVIAAGIGLAALT